MRYLLGFLAIVTFALPAHAAPPVSQQEGFVCNTEKAVVNFETGKQRLTGVAVAEIAKRVSTPSDWCVAGVVKVSRPTREVEDKARETLEIIAFFLQMQSGTASAGSVLEMIADTIPRTLSYRTEHGKQMFFVARP
jgi:hypothetical protein